MPPPLADREDALEAVKALVLQGVKTAAISKQTGVNPKTVRTWIRRNGWNVLASKNGENGDNQGDSTPGDVLENVSERVKRRIADVLDKLSEKMKINQPISVRDLQSLASIAEKVFGWGDGRQPGQHIHLHAATELRDERSARLRDLEERPVEVEATPVLAVSR